MRRRISVGVRGACRRQASRREAVATKERQGLVVRHRSFGISA
ncbi:hypothetical protein COO91_05287 [Nostoc flagelliforme CCNUN1]|uniref:Uncharacterized protein n=1 Tax=Nostoc flagelliforme CCNUN1 TaxID=2038116 RepID=A0A2K8SX11_9NOSO|nr:hypothetical protein COO91_05287 [Nostoc flagelliforme CCNUN1]